MASNDDPLSEMYQSIVQQTSSMDKPWPDSDGFANCCLGASTASSQNASTSNDFQVPAFPKGTGPLGVFALTRENQFPGNEDLVQKCLDAFDQFCDELNALLEEDDQEVFFLVKSLVPHITVAIFQEHPQLLPKKQKQLGLGQAGNDEKAFHFFTDSDGNLLAESLAKQTSKYSPIQLTLHSLILTPDGAMIAGFVENGDYGKLKTDILTNAKQVMGMEEFTSRPKNLIHITCGRVVRKQQGALELPTTQDAIQDLVVRYNQQRFPMLVADVKSSGSNGGTLVLEQMTVLRNDVWLCEQNTVYGVGRLQGQDKPVS